MLQRGWIFLRAITGNRFVSTSSLPLPSSSLFVTHKVEVAPDKRTRAVVLVLGFGGAKPKHVAKYSQLYNNTGCSTVSGTASNHDIFVDQKGLDVFANEAVKEVTKILREEDGGQSICSKKKTPIVMHIISNGGAFVTRRIGHMLDTRDQRQDDAGDLDLFANRLKLGCQVFDSAPCYSDIKSNFNVIKELIPNPLFGIPAAMLFALRKTIVPRAIQTVTGKPTNGDLFWKALLEDTNCDLQAFIYSDNDEVANSEMIRDFIFERKKRGVNVMSKHFKDSVHVQHLRLHEKEYSDFINDVLLSMEGCDSERENVTARSKL